MTREEIEKKAIKAIAEAQGVPVDWIEKLGDPKQVQAWAEFGSALVAEAYERAERAVEGERLTGETGDEGDIAYNTALEHAIEAIRALKTRLAGEVKV